MGWIKKLRPSKGDDSTPPIGAGLYGALKEAIKHSNTNANNTLDVITSPLSGTQESVNTGLFAVNAVVEDFEDDTFMFPIEATTDVTWAPDTEVFFEGTRSYKSGKIGHSQKTAFKFTLDNAADMSFNYRVSSEAGYDKLIVKVDGTKVMEDSGNNDWKFITLPNVLGTVEISYEKDSSSSSGSDCAWIDMLTIGVVTPI